MTTTDPTAAPVLGRLSTLDRFLPVWIVAAMALGLLLGRAVPGLDDALQTVSIGSVSLPKLASRELSYFRCRHIGYVFQSYNLIQSLTALENVQVGALLRHGRVAEARRRALDVLDELGLGPRAHLRARDLTTAERKRVEIARALATEPRAILLDEAMSGLNPKEVADAVALVRRLRERGLTIVLVEHVLEVVMPLAETVIVLQQGRKIAEGAPQQLARDPAVIAAYLGPRFAHG